MRRRVYGGFGLIELLLAMALSLVVVLGVVQLFIAAKSTYLSQSASAALQEDARYVLSKMLQEIRMVGLSGCLASIEDLSAAGDFSWHIRRPIEWDAAARRLTLIAADVGQGGGLPTWTVLTDCMTAARAYTGSRRPPPGQWALPIRRLTYTVQDGQLYTGTGTGPNQAVLVSNVEGFDVSFGVANAPADLAAAYYTDTPGDPSLIRSVRLGLVLKDPTGRVRSQAFNGLAALRNRLP